MEHTDQCEKSLPTVGDCCTCGAEGVTNEEAFMYAVLKEVKRARELFPIADGLMCALTEEVGEVARAMLDESDERVWAEAVQTAAMCVRLAIEGDPTLDALRAARRGGDDGRDTT